MIDQKTLWDSYNVANRKKQRLASAYKNKLLLSKTVRKPKINDPKSATVYGTYRMPSKRSKSTTKRKIHIKQSSSGKPQRFRNLNNSKEQIVEAFREIQIVKQLRFLRASKQLFRSMNIFGKKVITEANINRLIPEPALYFLGTVFQKLRKTKIEMNEDQFVKQCEKICFCSNKDDIDCFVKAIEEMGENGLNTNIKVSWFDDQNANSNVEGESKVQQKIQLCHPQEVQIITNQFARNRKKVSIQSNNINLFENSDKCLLKERVNFLNEEVRNQNRRLAEKGISLDCKASIAPKAQELPQQIPAESWEFRLQSQKKDKENSIIQEDDLPFERIRVKPRDCANRIDRLSSRVEDFIKRNAERLVLSKAFRQKL